MKKNIFAVFAHPDDESFGPGGTLALLAKTNNIILIYATAGEACTVSKNFKEDIRSLRKQELVKAAVNLKASDIIHLDYSDGQLCNEIYKDLYSQLEKHIKDYHPVSLLTFEPRGFSGHIDHICVTSVIQHLYRRYTTIESLHLFAINQRQRRLLNDYFVYLPPGYHHRQINTVVDVASVWDQKQKAIESYQSQESDRKFWSTMLNQYKQHEHFISYYRSTYHPFMTMLSSENIKKADKSYCL